MTCSEPPLLIIQCSRRGLRHYKLPSIGSTKTNHKRRCRRDRPGRRRCTCIPPSLAGSAKRDRWAGIVKYGIFSPDSLPSTTTMTMNSIDSNSDSETCLELWSEGWCCFPKSRYQHASPRGFFFVLFNLLLRRRSSRLGRSSLKDLLARNKAKLLLPGIYVPSVLEHPPR